MHPETVFEQIQQFRAKSQELADHLDVVSTLHQAFPDELQKHLLVLGCQVLESLDSPPWNATNDSTLEARLLAAETAMSGGRDLPASWIRLVGLCRETLAQARAVAHWAVLV